MCPCSRNSHVSDLHLKDYSTCFDTPAVAGVFTTEVRRTYESIPLKDDFFLGGEGIILDGPSHSHVDLMIVQVINHSGQTNEALAPRNQSTLTSSSGSLLLQI